MTETRIIPATPDLADVLTRITIAAKRHWNYPEHWVQAWLPLLTILDEYIEEHEVWVALFDDEPVGYYSIKVELDEIWLDNLWVLPEHMGKGVGGALFDHAIVCSRQRGISSLKIEADPHAESFYIHVGAHRVGEHHSEIDGFARILPVMEYKI